VVAAGLHAILWRPQSGVPRSSSATAPAQDSCDSMTPRIRADLQEQTLCFKRHRSAAQRWARLKIAQGRGSNAATNAHHEALVGLMRGSQRRTCTTGANAKALGAQDSTSSSSTSSALARLCCSVVGSRNPALIVSMIRDRHELLRIRTNALTTKPPYANVDPVLTVSARCSQTTHAALNTTSIMRNHIRLRWLLQVLLSDQPLDVHSRRW
jgi:hypothetical protein